MMHHHKCASWNLKTERRQITAVIALLLATFSLALPPIVAAQTTDASIIGDVIDPTGAAVVDATVTVINVATGSQKVEKTSNSGQFRAYPLASGTYQIKVAAAGFETFVRNGILLDVASTVKMSATLRVGASSDQVVVNASAPLLQTQDAVVGATVSQADLERLPINGRNYTKLILLSPGASDRGSAQSQGTFSGTNLYSLNGQRQQDNNYLIDGIDNNFLYQNSPGMSPPQDAIQEFRVMNDTSAEFGRSAGANVNVAIRSGGSQLHGTLYEYVRNEALDANDWFRKHNGLPIAKNQWNQFGVTAGGPLLIPRIYDGRSRTFWFADCEGFRQNQGSTIISSVPTAAERGGDLSALGKNLYDPFSSTTNAGRTLFPGGIIPQGRLSSSALYWLNAILPLPNNGTGLVNNYVNTNELVLNRDLWNLRVDHILTSRDTLFFRYSYQNVTYTNPAVNSTATAYQTQQASFNVRNSAMGWTHLFRNNGVLQAEFGYNDPALPIHDVNSHTTRAALLQGANLAMFQQDVIYESLPGLSVAGEFSYSTGTGGGGQVSEDHILQPLVSYSQTLGHHSLKLGGTLHLRTNYLNSANPMNGSLSFAATQTGNGSGGDSLASFLLGVPSSYALATGGDASYEAHGPYQAYYALDDWRATSKLSISAGLRYEITSPPYATNDQIGTLTIQYAPNSPNASANGYTYTQYWAGNNPYTNQGPQRGSYGEALQTTKYGNIAPRLGIAFQLEKNTVVRAGYGIFYNSTFFQEIKDKRGFYPYIQSISNTVNASGTPTFLITSPSPSVTGNIGGYAQDVDKPTPTSHQWNLYVQHQFPGQISLEAGYFGSYSYNQIGYTYINQAALAGGATLGTSINSRRPIPTLGDLNGGLNNVEGDYNSFRVNAVKRFSSGLSFTANYTLGKAQTTQSSLGEINTQNQYDSGSDYGRASYDIRHIFQAAYAWELPIGKGKLFLNHLHPALNAAIGGWSLDGITRIETGSPYNPVLSIDNANVGASKERPNQVGDPKLSNATRRSNAIRNLPIYNLAAFALPTAGTFGNAPQNAIEGDGRNSWDVALQKQWHTWREQSLVMRTEFFNFPNHVNFQNPSATFGAASAGIATSATPSRQIQMAIRYNY